MSNGGFDAYMTSLGIVLERTPVGDKYVAQKIKETGALVGGEQSGHIIFPRRGPTGDGLVTMLELLRVLQREGRHADVALVGRGRVVVRPSGTQPVIRVMVEADEYELRDQIAETIVDAMVRELGGVVHGRVDLTYALGD